MRVRCGSVARIGWLVLRRQTSVLAVTLRLAGGSVQSGSE